VPMIENYRTQLCWDLFMANPEIKDALLDIGWTFTGDFDGDGDRDSADYARFADCMTGPDIIVLPDDCTIFDLVEADIDDDNDVDLHDAMVFTRLFDGP